MKKSKRRQILFNVIVTNINLKEIYHEICCGINIINFKCYIRVTYTYKNSSIHCSFKQEKSNLLSETGVLITAEGL